MSKFSHIQSTPSMHNGHKEPARLQAKFFMSSAFPPFTLCLKFQSFTSHFAAFRTFRLTHLFLISLQTERNRGIFSPFKPTSVQIHAYLSRQSILSFFSNMPMFERKGRHLFPEIALIFRKTPVFQMKIALLLVVFGLNFR